MLHLVLIFDMSPVCLSVERSVWFRFGELTLTALCSVMTALFFPLFWPLEFLGRIRIVVQNYWANGVIMAALGIFPFFCLPGVLTGFCFVISGIFFIIGMFW